MEAAHRTSLAKGEVGIRDKKPVTRLVDFCIDRIEPWATIRPSWLWYRSGIRPVLRYKAIAGMELQNITSEHVADYGAHRQSHGLAVGTINRELRVLRRVLRLAVEWGLLERAPNVQMLRGEKRRERVICEEEFAEYLTCASPLLSEVATILHDTGLRPDECHRLRWEDVTWMNGRNGTLLVTNGKSQAARRVLPMSPRIRAILQDRSESAGNPLEGWIFAATTQTGHIDHSSLKKQHTKALKLSGVRPFVLYTLRHTFLTRLGQSGCDAWTLARIAGHSSIGISSRYVHPSEDAVLSALSRLGRHNSGHNQILGRSPTCEVNLQPPESTEDWVVSAAGLEPATHALKGHCSTN